MLNVKQGSCEYQPLKSLGLTRPGNRTLVYTLMNYNLSVPQFLTQNVQYCLLLAMAGVSISNGE